MILSATRFTRSRVRFSAYALPLLALLFVAANVATAATRADDVPVIGVVKDTSGNPVSNVQVVVSSLNRSALSDEKGQFIFRGLPPGTYHLDLVRIGYSSQHTVVTVPTSGDVVRVTVVMKVATIRLASVNVTATPTGSDPLNTTQATVQLSGKELQRSVSSSLGQTLANEPGMAARFNGPVAAAPVIRGLSGERVLVLQDGDRTGDLSSSAVDHLNAVDPNNAERIEVIRGPASLLYGNNALGGVVNVITNDIPSSVPSNIGGFLSAQSESVAPGGVGSIGVSMPLGEKVALSARGGLRTFNDMRVGGGAVQDNTNGKTSNGSIGAAVVHSRGNIGVGVRFMNFEYGLPHPEGEEAVRLDGQRQQVTVQSTLSTGMAALNALRLNASAQWYGHDEIEEGGEIGTRFRLNTQTFDISAKTMFANVSGAVGLQGLHRRYDPTGEEAFTPAASNGNIAFFVFQDIPVKLGDNAEHSPHLQVGARMDRWSVSTAPRSADEIVRFGEARTRTFDNLAASIGLSVPVREGISINANVSRGFRAPTVEELFSNGFHAAAGTFDIGNSGLIPEKNTGLDAGLRVQRGETFAQIGTYYNMVDDYIRPVEVDAESDEPRVTFGQADARLYGFEAQLETHLLQRVIGGLMADYTRAELTDSRMPLPFVPAGRIGASLRYDNGRLSAGGDARHVFAQTRISGDALDVPTESYTLLDISGTWIFTVRASTVHSLTLRADNLLDAKYRDATSRIKSFSFNPGRNISIVYRLLY